jgi:hypothetical protein
LKALSKYSKDRVSDKYLNNYSSVKLVFINGEELSISKRDAKYKKDIIENYIERNIISEAYKIYPNGKEIKIMIR